MDTQRLRWVPLYWTTTMDTLICLNTFFPPAGFKGIP